MLHVCCQLDRTKAPATYCPTPDKTPDSRRAAMTEKRKPKTHRAGAASFVDALLDISAPPLNHPRRECQV